LFLSDGDQALAAEPGFHGDPPQGGGPIGLWPDSLAWIGLRFPLEKFNRFDAPRTSPKAVAKRRSGANWAVRGALEQCNVGLDLRQ